MQKDVETGVHDSFLQEALRLQQKSAAKASKRVRVLTLLPSYHPSAAPVASAHLL